MIYQAERVDNGELITGEVLTRMGKTFIIPKEEDETVVTIGVTRLLIYTFEEVDLKTLMEKPICQTCKKEIEHNQIKAKAFNWFSEKYGKKKFVEAVKIHECDCPNVIVESEAVIFRYVTKAKFANVVKLYEARK